MEALTAELNAFFAGADRVFDLAGVVNGVLPTGQTTFYGAGAYDVFLSFEAGREFGGTMSNHAEGGVIAHVSNPELPAPGTDGWLRLVQTVIHELEHGFGCGLGEEYMLEWMADPVGLWPFTPISSYDPEDPYWSNPFRSDAFDDPIFRFSRAPRMQWLTREICRGDYRLPARMVPVRNELIVRVLGEAGAARPGRVRVWHIDRGNGFDQGRDTLLADEWTAELKMPFSVNVDTMPTDRVRLVRVDAEGHLPVEGWVSYFDLQRLCLAGGDQAVTVRLASTEPVPPTRLVAGDGWIKALHCRPGVWYELVRYEAGDFSDAGVPVARRQADAAEIFFSLAGAHHSPAAFFRVRNVTGPGARPHRGAPSVPGVELLGRAPCGLCSTGGGA